ncbi:transmembrane ascorbate-dependent reductase CYB561-like isoform X2 [Physella acuta]|nr:transmembrane ascorbate-dependent reductase CYB561-like isoform X2 [Physella acuta]XP_059159392.1 transmembrane ascorbate-dependent reductase CYB561-like isoform X2 [Physella acuta]
MYFDGNAASSADMRYFNWLVLAVQVLGVVSVVITAVWMGHFRGGFAWQSDPLHEFNYHPLFMIIGMVFLYADAILAYRVFRNDRKILIKILHACMHIFALIFASVGLKAVFDSHNLNSKPIPNLYSLHSWVGLFVVVCFGLQWVLGFVSFLWPKLGMGARAMYMPYHTFWGVLLLILATATALMGITEKAFIHKEDIQYSSLSSEAILINCLGIILLMFTGLVVYLVTKPEYKRQPAPEEDHVALDN